MYNLNSAWIASSFMAVLSASAVAYTGGTEVSVKDFPGVVQFRNCTGAKIAPATILTAAHCISEFRAERTERITLKSGDELTVRIGGRNTNERREFNLPVATTAVHPSWDSGIDQLLEFGVDEARAFDLLASSDAVADLAVVRFESDFDAPNLPVSSKKLVQGAELWIGGYGFGNYAPLFDLDHFRYAKKRLAVVGDILAMVAANDANENFKSAAGPGDSGAPVLIEIDGVRVVVGVVSLGYGALVLDQKTGNVMKETGEVRTGFVRLDDQTALRTSQFISLFLK